MLKLVTDDGRKFIVSKTALKASYTLADLRYCFDAGDTSEVTVEEPIEIHFDSKLLALGLEWCDSQNGTLSKTTIKGSRASQVSVAKIWTFFRKFLHCRMNKLDISFGFFVLRCPLSISA